MAYGLEHSRIESTNLATVSLRDKVEDMHLYSLPTRTIPMFPRSRVKQLDHAASFLTIPAELRMQILKLALHRDRPVQIRSKTRQKRGQLPLPWPLLEAAPSIANEILEAYYTAGIFQFELYRRANRLACQRWINNIGTMAKRIRRVRLTCTRNMFCFRSYSFPSDKEAITFSVSSNDNKDLFCSVYPRSSFTPGSCGCPLDVLVSTCILEAGQIGHSPQVYGAVMAFVLDLCQLMKVEGCVAGQQYHWQCEPDEDRSGRCGRCGKVRVALMWT